jgi:hypothetical protein
MPEFLSLLALLAVAWYWHDSLKAREAAMRTARSACEAEGLQLLDDTVALAGLKPVRNENGRLVLQRTYAFEYSDTGDNRRRGSIVMVGQRATVVNIGLRLVAGARTLH